MIVIDKNTKNMVIPRGLGNFVTEGSGVGITTEEAAQIASAVTEEAIDEYNAELQVDIEEIRDAVSGNSQDIAILSGLSTDIAAISGQTTANTQNIGILSGNVETLSQTVAGKQDALTAGNGISISGTTISLKAGEGLGFSGDTLVVSGGSGEQNYVIVNQLGDITNPVKGMLAYVKYNVINKAWVIDASQISENFVAYIYYDGENYARVYRSDSGDFHWNWNNGAFDWTYGNNVWYKIDRDNGLFYAACDNQAAYITLENGATSAETTAQLTVDSPYLYNGTAWEKKSLVTDYFLENMTSAERLSLYNMLTDIMGGSNDGGGLTKIFSNYRFFTAAGGIDGQVASQVFFSNFENEGVYFCGVKSSKLAYGAEVYRVVAYISGNDGSLQTNVDSTNQSVPIVSVATFGNNETGTLTYSTGDGLFYLGGNSIQTGDTTSYVQDLLDYNYSVSLFNVNGKFNDDFIMNVYAFTVEDGNGFFKYSHPALSLKTITSYTINDATFSEELTLIYSDYTVKVDIAENNRGANLRITANQ